MRLVSSVTWVPSRATAKEIHRAAFADQLDGLLPGFRHSHGLNGDVHAAILRRKRARLADGGANVGRLHHMRRAQLLAPLPPGRRA